VSEHRGPDGRLYDEIGMVPELDMGALAERLIEEGYLDRENVRTAFATMRLPEPGEPR
jgi:hypothetical protein